MRLVTIRPESDANIERLESYLAQDTGPDAEFARGLIARGICFVVVTRGQGPSFFAPSRFVGYVDNSRHAHLRNIDKDARETNQALFQALHRDPIPGEILEREYRARATLTHGL